MKLAPGGLEAALAAEAETRLEINLSHLGQMSSNFLRL
jgi:hypothetical protein